MPPMWPGLCWRARRNVSSLFAGCFVVKCLSIRRFQRRLSCHKRAGVVAGNRSAGLPHCFRKTGSDKLVYSLGRTKRFSSRALGFGRFFLAIIGSAWVVSMLKFLRPRRFTSSIVLSNATSLPGNRLKARNFRTYAMRHLNPRRQLPGLNINTS